MILLADARQVVVEGAYPGNAGPAPQVGRLIHDTGGLPGPADCLLPDPGGAHHARRRWRSPGAPRMLHDRAGRADVWLRQAGEEVARRAGGHHGLVQQCHRLLAARPGAGGQKSPRSRRQDQIALLMMVKWGSSPGNRRHHADRVRPAPRCRSHCGRTGKSPRRGRSALKRFFDLVLVAPIRVSSTARRASISACSSPQRRTAAMISCASPGRGRQIAALAGCPMASSPPGTRRPLRSGQAHARSARSSLQRAHHVLDDLAIWFSSICIDPNPCPYPPGSGPACPSNRASAVGMPHRCGTPLLSQATGRSARAIGPLRLECRIAAALRCSPRQLAGVPEQSGLCG